MFAEHRVVLGVSYNVRCVRWLVRAAYGMLLAACCLLRFVVRCLVCYPFDVCCFLCVFLLMVVVCRLLLLRWLLFFVCCSL